MTGTEMEVRQPSQAVAVQDELTIEQLSGQVQKIQQAMAQVMKKGEHYGTIPGAGTKQILFKAGAEKLCLLFRLDPEYEVVEAYDADGHYTARVSCTLSHITTGNRMGSGLGLCTSKETKYALRYDKQTRQRVPNDHLADTYNTVLKMACKRALVAAVLNTTAASDIFTQDLEDAVEVVVAAPVTPAPDLVYNELMALVTSCAQIDEGLWGPEVIVANAARKFGRPILSLKELSEQEANAIIEGAKGWLNKQLDAEAEKLERARQAEAEAKPKPKPKPKPKAPEEENPLNEMELKAAANFPPNVPEELKQMIETLNESIETVEGELVDDSPNIDWPGEAPA